MRASGMNLKCNNRSRHAQPKQSIINRDWDSESARSDVDMQVTVSAASPS